MPADTSEYLGPQDLPAIPAILARLPAGASEYLGAQGPPAIPAIPARLPSLPTCLSTGACNVGTTRPPRLASLPTCLPAGAYK
mmetsp:Transcript_24458/g.68008  ORF Transcript_24458/g.68008 Transcript_24458/m.68008 type:complete len:83 (+) Transcript_24458:48-296(+)